HYLGVVYTDSAKKHAEHGGFAPDDTNVMLLVSKPDFEARTVTSFVETTQVAPAILRALGLDPQSLESVQQEGTPVLPGIDLSAAGGFSLEVLSLECLGRRAVGVARFTALVEHYPDLDTAAAALGFASVQEMQDAMRGIYAYCGVSTTRQHPAGSPYREGAGRPSRFSPLVAASERLKSGLAASGGAATQGLLWPAYLFI